jgi:PST family polysaccharide transporter
MMNSLNKQVHFGAKWSSVAQIVTRLTRFLTTVVLARILAPESFGIVAMANVSIETMGLIREIGFGTAFIQRQEKTPDDVALAANTTFLIGLVINGLLLASGFFVAPAIADFFDQDSLDLILRVMFLTFVFDAVSTIPNLVLQRELEFGKLAVCEIAQSVVYAAVGISMALLGYGVWSLVAAQLSSRMIFTILVFKQSPWSPRLEFSFEITKELFSYGRYIWAFVLLSAAGKVLDKAVVGKFYGAANLGYYSIAFNICNMPATQISSLVNRITFPAFSRIQHDLQLLKKAFLKTYSFVALIALPIAFGLLAVSEPLVLTVYGSKWEPMVPLINVLAFFGMSLSISSITGPIFQAIGKPKVLLYTSILHHFIQISLLILLSEYEVLGICYAVLIPMLVSSAIAFILIHGYINLTWGEVFEPVIRSLITSAAMFFSIKFLEILAERTFNSPPGVTLVLLVMFGIVAYIAGSFIVNKAMFFDFTKTFKTIIRSKGNLV